VGEKSDKHLLDRRLAGLAGRQHGVVSRAQLVGLGLSDEGIRKRVVAGRLHRLHRGVYAVGHPAVTQQGRWLAAVLACGPGAVLSHGSAAQLWGLPWRQKGRIDVTVPGTGGRRRRRLVVVHRSPLPADEVATKDGISVTSPSRTLVDLADYGRRRALERAIDEAAFLRLDSTGVVPRQGRRGKGLLADVLARHEPGSTRTKSNLEEAMLAMCRAHELPQPEVNADAEGYESDFVWRGQRLIVEADSRAAHLTQAAFEKDRLRDADLTAAGWRVIRVSDTRLLTQPEAVGAQLRRLL
jgi:very-short-patch-repair endonuclease/predicted transcriptional regulator of viral defense system